MHAGREGKGSITVCETTDENGSANETDERHSGRHWVAAMKAKAAALALEAAGVSAIDEGDDDSPG